jgi:hypothetical protein
VSVAANEEEHAIEYVLAVVADLERCNSEAKRIYAYIKIFKKTCRWWHKGRAG